MQYNRKERELFQSDQHQDLAKADLAILVFPWKKGWYRRSQTQQTFIAWICEWICNRLSIASKGLPLPAQLCRVCTQAEFGFGEHLFCCWKQKDLHSSYKLLQPPEGGNPEGISCFQHTYVLLWNRLRDGKRDTLRGRFSLLTVVRPIYI